VGRLGFDSLQGQGVFPFATAFRAALDITMGTGALSQGLKRLGREASHSSPSSADVPNAWSYTSTCIFVAWYFVKHREKRTFIYIYIYIL